MISEQQSLPQNIKDNSIKPFCKLLAFWCILSKTDATHFKVSPLARIVQSSFHFFTTVSLLGTGTIPSISKNPPKNLTLGTNVFATWSTPAYVTYFQIDLKIRE